MANHHMLMLHSFVHIALYWLPLFYSVAIINAAASTSNILHLPTGFKFSLAPPGAIVNHAFIPTMSDLMLAAGDLNSVYDLFMPVLSSPSFNTTYDAHTQGFSLGFLFRPVALHTDSPQVYSMYLAVCAGRSGNYSGQEASHVVKYNPKYQGKLIWGPNDSNYHAGLLPEYTVNGYVVPVHILNPDRPLGSVYSTLIVVSMNHTDGQTVYSTREYKELQLRDRNGEVAWSVGNVGMMEMQDSGDLLLYNSSSLPNRVVWRSSEEPLDVLFQWQMMKPGMQLQSQNGAYRARMEKGGLLLYQANSHFINPDPPYWVLSVPFVPRRLGPANSLANFSSLNALVLSSPCSGQDEAYMRLGNSTWQLYLSGGSCVPRRAYSITLDTNETQYMIETSGNQSLGPLDSWSFLRLEDDGRIQLYVFTHSDNPSGSLQKRALDSKGAGLITSLYANNESQFEGPHVINNEELVPAFLWGLECDLPMRCGPLGVCTPGTPSVCTCSSPQLPDALEPINSTELSYGCKRKPSSRLPACTEEGKEHVNNTRYVEVKNTTTLFLLSLWQFNASATGASVETCKQLCSDDCSCNGFFYQTDDVSAACFFMTQEITLLYLQDVETNLQSLLYAFFLQQNSLHVVASSHTTYIKVGLIGSNLSYNTKYGSNLSYNTKYGFHLSYNTYNGTNVTHGSNKPSDISTFPLLGIIPLVIAACLIMLLVVAACFTLPGLATYSIYRAAKQIILLNKQSSSTQASATEEEWLQTVLPHLPSRFPYKELEKATDNFNNLLGEGGCGSVYAGTLAGGRKVAVKILELPNSKALTKQFLAELATIGRTSHQNIVHLVGFCWDAVHRLLVYEYVERGSLDRWLFKQLDDNNIIEGSNSLAAAHSAHDVPPHLIFNEWRTRYDVALGIARGLSYLHEECPEPILHFDIKPQNILLDKNFVPKLADFGMSRFIQRDVSNIVTGLRGTPGYIAPEWVSHGAVGKKSDVFSMGMLMLEIVGGRKNYEISELIMRENSSFNGGQTTMSARVDDEDAWHFPSWAAMKCEKGLMMELLDKRVRNTDMEQMRRLVYTAFWCIVQDPKMRPSASMVVQWLEESMSSIKEPPLSSIRAPINLSSSSTSEYSFM